MPWNPRNTMNLRLEFVELASHEGANRRELCRRFGISPKTAYKWLGRHAREGEAAANSPSAAGSRPASPYRADSIAPADAGNSPSPDSFARATSSAPRGPRAPPHNNCANTPLRAAPLQTD